MRPTDAEFVRHTLQAVVTIAARQNSVLDSYTIKRIDKANRILETEQHKPRKTPFTPASEKNLKARELL